MNEVINVIIVDDEEEAREGLKVIVNEKSEYHLQATAKNGLEAISMINRCKPDLVLLDIQMPEINGFDVINNLNPDVRPFIIFVTAHDSYALKAFEHHAIDYILKPFTNSRLYKALEHAKGRVNQNVLNKKLTNLLEDYKKEKLQGETDALINPQADTDELRESQRLVVKSLGKIHFINVQDIIWVQAYDYYIKIHVKDKFYLVRQSLKSMEARLPDEVFYRVHKSSIVNIEHIRNIRSKHNGDYELALSTGTNVNMSRNYKACLKEICESV